MKIPAYKPILSVHLIICGCPLFTASAQPVASATMSVDYGTAAVGTTSPPANVALINSGNEQLTVSKFSINDPEFSIQTNFCTQGVKPGTICNVYVVFTPASAGSHTGSLTFVTNGGSPMVTLTGIGGPSRIAIKISPGSLGFGAQAIGATSPAEPVTIASVGSEPLTISSVSTNGPAFAVQSSNCNQPVSPGATCVIHIVFAPAEVETYTGGALEFTADAPSPGTRYTVPLTGTGMNPGASVQLQPATTYFSYQLGGTLPMPQTVTLTTSSESPVTFALADPPGTPGACSFAAVTPLNGMVTAASPATLSIALNGPGINGLGPGMTECTLLLNTTPADGGAPLTLTEAVYLTVTGIVTSQTALTFQAPRGNISPAAQSFVLINATPASISYATNACTVSGGSCAVSGGSWLSVSGGTGLVAAMTVSAPLKVSVNPSGLVPGDYYGMLEIDVPGAPNSGAAVTEAVVTVVLNVLPAGTNPGAEVALAGLVFLAGVDEASPAGQSVAITNVFSSSTTFSAAISPASSPFTVTPAQGTIAAGQTVNVQVQANSSSLAAATYSATLMLGFPGGVTRMVDLLLVAAPGGGQSARPRDMTQGNAEACTATQLLLVFSYLGETFGSNVGWGTPVDTIVVDDCANVVTNGSVVVTFSDGEQQLGLAQPQNGAVTWCGTWDPQNAAAAVTLTATAMDLRGLTGSTSICVNVQPNPNPGVPILNPGGIVSNASYSAAAMPSPGEMVAIFGSNLADGMESAQSLPLPTQMQNAFVLIIGQGAIPLLYVSPGQIDAVVPYGVTPGAYQAIAANGNRLSVPQNFTFAAAKPAIFTTMGTGQGDIFVVFEPPSHATYSLADGSAPATAGDYLTIYCTGLGSVMPAVTAGTAAPSSPPLAQTVNPVSLTIGGVRATVTFMGLAPGFTGLYQVNAIVPSGVPAGPDVQVMISVDGISSPAVTMAIK